MSGLGQNLYIRIYQNITYDRIYIRLWTSLSLKKNITANISFFIKRATDLYLQTFYNYINITKNKGFFTCLEDKYEKERYLEPENMELRNALSKLRLSSH